MARIKLDIPSELPFVTELAFRVTDLNYAGHVGNDSILSLMHEARYQFFLSLGYPDELELDGVRTILADVSIVYLAEGFYGKRLWVEVGAGDISRVSFDLYYRFSMGEEKTEMVLAKTGIVCLDQGSGKVCSVPVSVKNKLFFSQTANDQ